MAEAIADKSEEAKKPELSPEEKAKDVAAAELLKEMEAEETPSDPGETKKDESSDEGEDESGSESDAEADRGSQPDTATRRKKKSGYKKRVSRLVNAREEALAETEEVSQQLQAEREEKKLLKMRIQQLEGQPGPVTEPNPDSYDGGEIDDDYLKAKKAFDNAQLQKMVRETVAETNQQGNQTLAKENYANALKKKQEKHWEKADELGASDYDEAEEEVVKVMGGKLVNAIINDFPGDSHKVIYYLGKNPEEAEDIAEMLADGSTASKGVAEIGRIIERQSLNDQHTPITPDPDEETEGSAPSPQEALQQKLDKLREQATKSGSGGMKKILAFKKKAKERGITLR